MLRQKITPPEVASVRSSSKGKLRIIPLGGQEEVGRNMTVFEYEDNIVILDMGLQFPEEDMPGIDYIIPDTHYLKGKEKNIKAVILSHGHLDHIGAVPHLLPLLNWPPVYASKLTLTLVKKRLEESNLTKYLKAREIQSANETLVFGQMKIGFFEVSHSIMDALGIVIQTPFINVVNLGDWRYDLDPVSGPKTDFSNLAKWNTKIAPSVLMMESLGSTTDGSQLSEREVLNNIRNIIVKAPGRIIVGAFSSMIERVGQLINVAEELGKKVALDGYSMKTNMEIAKEIGYLKFKPSTLIDIKNVHDYPPQKIVIICTGAQGEDRAALMRIANGDHKWVKVEKSDTIIFDSSVIPGNERTIQRLKDSLYRQGADVIHKEIMDVHSGGHAFIEDIKLLINQVKPHYLLPIYANHYLLKEAAKVAESIGFPKERIFVLDNGSVVEIDEQSLRISKEKIPIEYIFVDGLGVGDISNVVLRDRQLMSADGMFVIIAVVDTQTGRVKGEPDIISRGFVYMKDSKDLLRQARKKIKETIIQSTIPGAEINWVYIRNNLRDKLGKFLYVKTRRRPMVLPVIVEI
ncbi:ribonuclease J [Patescibacteria group bacterium]|nr:ribonuclease J [Patescibacteria group bacterium]